MSHLCPILSSPYEPLPTNAAPPKLSYRRFLLPVGLSILVSSCAVWYFATVRSFNPLDDISQPRNTSPVLRHSYTPPPPPQNGSHAVVSTLYSDSFAIGVAVLGHSLRKANTSARLILPYLPTRVSAPALCIVRAAGWNPHPIALIPPPHNGKGIHHRFQDQYTKLTVWSFDSLGVEKLVYLDADTLVRRNFDELFELPWNFAAVPDVYVPGDSRGFALTFNAGVLVLETSTSVFEDMKAKIESATYPLEQAEQSFLNLYYAARTVRLPYIYNLNLAIKKRSRTLWESLKGEGKIVHYTIAKPFPVAVDGGILTREAEEEALKKAEQGNGGLYVEEIGWWRDAYELMLWEMGEEIERCRTLQDS